jgi:hypothetical protein
MKMTRRCLLALVLVAACTVPSVPVPPPEVGAMSFDLDTEARTATYSASLGPNWGDAWVIVQNERSGEGAALRADADGRVGPTQPFAAVAGDQVFVRFELPEQSTGFCLVLRDGQLTRNDICP